MGEETTVVEFEDGIAIHGSFPSSSSSVLEAIDKYHPEKFPLVIADPPYGNVVSAKWDKVGKDDKVFVQWMLDWTKVLQDRIVPNGALYVWGGIGKPNFRPFYRYLVDVEVETGFTLSNHITWGKKRGYGVVHNYLFTREELAYLCLGNPKRPYIFNIPLLKVLRGYSGYNAKYPAKSEFLRRTNVWSDITEVLQGKVHDCQKPLRVLEIPIEVHTRKGDTVLDPFGGSGATAHAARGLDRKFILVEENKATFDLMVENLRAGSLKKAPKEKPREEEVPEEPSVITDEEEALKELGLSPAY